MPTMTAGATADELQDLVDRYVTPEDMPTPEWLTRHHLTAPLPGLRSLKPSTRALKRAMDIAISVFLLIVLAPLLLVIAVVVRLTSPGPVIFRQVRIGLNLRERPRDRRREMSAGTAPLPGNPERREADPERRRRPSYGKPFILYKFRTMQVDAEKHGARFAVAKDPRVTPVGRFLRLTRIDELPQLWNILSGEMSLVGPRPERPEFMSSLSREIPGYLQRLRLKPGLTGLAQVVNGYDNHMESFRKKVALDLLYLQNCSITNDLKILLRTIGVIVTGKGAL